jgi:putative peptidoglycan lipid II flippase
MAKGLFRSSAIVSVATMASRVLGLVRDVILANLIGAGLNADVYYFAQKIPNFLRRLFAEGAFAQAFVPVLSEYYTQHDIGKTQRLIASVAGTLGLITFGISLFAVLFSPLVVVLFGAGFIDEPPKAELAGWLLKITFPYLFFISLTALSGSVLNTLGQFSVPALSPVFLNICIITSALFVAPQLDEPTFALAWAIFVGGLVQLLFQLPFLLAKGMLGRPRWGWSDPGVQRILKLMLPALFGVSVSQINLLLDTQIASFLETGSISWLYYADRLLEFPLGVFGIAIATVILPALSKQISTENTEHYQRTLDWGLRMVCLIGIPSAIGLMILAEPLLITLFQYGQFSGDDTLKSSYSLMAYGAGLIFFMYIKVLAPGFFSRQDTKTPVKIGVYAMIANMVFNLILVFPFKHVGLAMATTLSAALNAWLLYHGLRKAGFYSPQSGWLLFAGRIIVACVVLVWIVHYFSPQRDVWLAYAVYERVVKLFMLVGAGVVSYGAVLLLLGLRTRHFRSAH